MISGYRPNGDSPIMPIELKIIRDRLMSGNNPWDFMLYTILLASCHMFLREDEVGSMTHGTVNNDITVVKSNGNVEGIAFQIKGKSDPVPVTLMMWWDHELPEFCPVRHLLAWIRISGIKEGYLFPSYNFLQADIMRNPNWDGNCTQGIAYTEVLATWKNLCSTLLTREGRWGAHSGRKTAYLFGVWGGGQDSDLMQSARHKTVKHAMKYKKDAEFLLSIAQQNMHDAQLSTPKWRSIFCDQHQLAMTLNSASRPFFQPLDKLAAVFLDDKCGFGNNNVTKQCRVIGEKILLFSHDYGVIDNYKTELTKVLQTLDPSIANRISTLHGRIIEELEEKINSNTNINTTTVTTATDESVAKAAEPPQEKKKRGGEWDHEARCTIGGSRIQLKKCTR